MLHRQGLTHNLRHLTAAVLARIHKGALWSMSQTRDRFQGSQEELFETLQPFVKHAGWFKYLEKPSQPVNSAILVSHKVMIRAVTAICPNLAFTVTLLTAVFRQLADDAAFDSLQTEADKMDWAETMTKRFKTACRHVAQSRLKKPRPKWLMHIDGPLAMAAPGRDGPAKEAPTIINTHIYIYYNMYNIYTYIILMYHTLYIYIYVYILYYIITVTAHINNQQHITLTVS